MYLSVLGLSLFKEKDTEKERESERDLGPISFPNYCLIPSHDLLRKKEKKITNKRGFFDMSEFA